MKFSLSCEALLKAFLGPILWSKNNLIIHPNFAGWMWPSYTIKFLWRQIEQVWVGSILRTQILKPVEEYLTQIVQTFEAVLKEKWNVISGWTSSDTHWKRPTFWVEKIWLYYKKWEIHRGIERSEALNGNNFSLSICWILCVEYILILFCKSFFFNFEV